MRRPAGILLGAIAISTTVGVVLTAQDDSSSSTTAPSTSSLTTPSAVALREDPEPTRLVSGPFLFRLIGTQAPSQTDGSPQARYTVLFRLSRGQDAVRRGSSSGAFNVADGGLEPYSFGRRDAHCFAGVVYGKGYDDPRPARRLDIVRPGTRVAVSIKPLTPTADGKSKLVDHAYVRHPRMHVTGVSGDVANYKLTSSTAQRTIRRMGCK